ncbi:hypothetical protein V565_104230, partial [Rhizoctonia solani 123E]
MPTTVQRVSHHRSQNLRAQKRAKYAGPAFDEIPTESDPRWTDDPEHSTPSSHQPRSGPPPDPLARSLTLPCHPTSDDSRRKDNAYYRCIASSVCSWTLKAWDRSLPRIYKHAARCKALRNWKPALWKHATSMLASMAPGGLGTLDTASKDDSDTRNGSVIIQRPPHANPFARYDPSINMSAPEQLDHALARLISASASPARLVDYPEWSCFTQLLNPSYNPPSSTYIRDRLIPAEARRAVLHMQEYLQNETNISLSFDGLTAGQQPVYTIHICTADRHTFLYRADIFYGSHNTDYIVDLLEQVSLSNLPGHGIRAHVVMCMQVIMEIGPHRIASVVSDDTATTKKARREASRKYPGILNLADPIHKFNLCIQDICQDPIWED